MINIKQNKKFKWYNRDNNCDNYYLTSTFFYLDKEFIFINFLIHRGIECVKNNKIDSIMYDRREI